MLRSNSKSLGNRVVSPEEETERLQTGGFAEKEGFKSACVVFLACVHLVHMFIALSLSPGNPFSQCVTIAC